MNEVVSLRQTPDSLALLEQTQHQTDARARFHTLLTYIYKRRSETLDLMANDRHEENPEKHFLQLQELHAAEQSHYLSRLIEWALLREIHDSVHYQDFLVDRSLSDPVLVKQYDDFWEGQSRELPRGLAYKFSDEAIARLTRQPNLQPLYDYALQAISAHPRLGDDDYYAPDPYQELLSVQTIRELGERKEIELAIETAHLFRVTVDELSPESQEQLFTFGLSMTDTEYERLHETVNTLDAPLRLPFAEAFLATEFGQDFGVILLECADVLAEQPDKLKAVMHNLQAIRDQAREIITLKYSEADAHPLAKADYTAFIKRATELLALIARGPEQDRTDAMLSLHLLDLILQEIARGYQNGFEPNSSTTPDFATFRAKDAALTITIRPDGQSARIGDTVTLRREDLPPELQSKDRRVSLRLDLEDGGLSRDIGNADPNTASKPARFIGQTLAKGELALVQRRSISNIHFGQVDQSITLHGHHTREVFTDVEMSPEEFRRLASQVLYHLKILPATAA